MLTINPNNLLWDKSRDINQQRELVLLTATVYLEARGESRTGKIAVAYVIMNRYRNKRRFPNTIQGVILQKYQFSSWNDYWYYKKAFDPAIKVWEECLEAALVAYLGTEDDPTNGADHFWSPKYTTPLWAKDYAYIDIKNHRFIKIY